EHDTLGRLRREAAAREARERDALLPAVRARVELQVVLQRQRTPGLAGRGERQRVLAAARELEVEAALALERARERRAAAGAQRADFAHRDGPARARGAGAVEVTVERARVFLAQVELDARRLAGAHRAGPQARLVRRLELGRRAPGRAQSGE